MTGFGLAFALIADRAGDFGEVTWFAEVFVNAGEADVGDVVEGFEAIHHRFADLARLDLVAARFELALDRRYQAIEPVGRNVAFAAGDGEGPRQLFPVERLAYASFLTTVRSRNWIRSNVVNRAPQPSHWRRRRIAAPSSLGRLSFTWLSSWAQNGQRIRYP